MKKKFNITGVCYPHVHYMMDNKHKLKEIVELIVEGEYFTINRPRQFGKTTSLFYLEELLQESKEYIVLKMSFEDIDDTFNESDNAFAQIFMRKLERAFKRKDADLYTLMQKLRTGVHTMNDLSDAITEIADVAQKKLVLLIDEVDASANYIPFLKFLAMLRTKYLDRYDPDNLTFYSIVLTAVHDIKALNRSTYRLSGYPQRTKRLSFDF